MQDNEIDIEKSVDNYAIQTINNVENKSKILLTTVGQIADMSNIRYSNR